MHLTRRTVTLALSSALLTTSMAPAGAVVGSPCKMTTVRTKAATWTNIRVPKFESPPLHDGAAYEQPAVDTPRFAVSAAAPRTIYVADEWSVYASDDGGCTWQMSLDFLARDGLPGADEIDRIVALAAPPRDGGPARAYALVDRAGVPTIAVRDVARGRWRVDALYDPNGVPLVGRPLNLWIAPGDPRVLYVLLWSDSYTWAGAYNPGTLRLYGSRDAGKTWELRHAALSGLGLWPTGDFSCPTGPPGCFLMDGQSLAIDPSDPDVLWTAEEDGVFRSEDGGVTWDNVYPVNRLTLGALGPVAVFGDGRPRAVAAFGSSKIAWSDDDGASWSLRDPPHGRTILGDEDVEPVESVAAATAGEVIAAVSGVDSYGDTNLQVMRSHGWARLTNPFSTCPGRDDGSAPCLRRVTYVPAARSYYAIDYAGRHLVAVRLRDDP